MHTIIDVKYIRDYILKIQFGNKTIKIVDLKYRIINLSSHKNSIFKALRNIQFFRKVRVNPEIGTICWPNNADFCPDVLYRIGKDD